MSTPKEKRVQARSWQKSINAGTRLCDYTKRDIIRMYFMVEEDGR